MNRIMISGVSGSGKTTLAEWISEYYKIPFLSTSTKPLWPKYGVKSHKELIQISQIEPQKGIEFQWDLLEYREKVIEKNMEQEGMSGFVSDRGPLDNIVYYLMQNSCYDKKVGSENYIKRALLFYLRYQITHQIILAYNDDMFKAKNNDDGMRITNPIYQLAVDGMFERVLRTYLTPEQLPKLKILILPMWDLAERKHNVISALSSLHLDI